MTNLRARVSPSLFLLTVGCDDFTCADYATCEAADSGTKDASPANASHQTAAADSTTRYDEEQTATDTSRARPDAGLESADTAGDPVSPNTTEALPQPDASADASDPANTTRTDASLVFVLDSSVSNIGDAATGDDGSDSNLGPDLQSDANYTLETGASIDTSTQVVTNTDNQSEGSSSSDASTTNAPDVTPELDGPCEEPSDVVCAGVAQQQRLICSMGFWAPNGACVAGENCDNRSGLCEPIVAGCEGKEPGASFCVDDTRVVCEGDLTTSTEEQCAGLCVQTADGAVCSIPECGDGRVQIGEACDDGNNQSEDGCLDCEVEPGFSCNTSSRPSTCEDINECDEGLDECSDNATCDNTEGSYTCACHSGFFGDGFDCSQPPSCVGLNETCGAGADDNCCAGPIVEGGDFVLGPSPGVPGNISTFVLDKYEVTVGRFRKFVAAFSGPPPRGAGAHPLIAGTGWDSDWNSQIADGEDDLVDAIEECADNTLLSTGDNDRLPINCVTWYEAFAFCEWDHGRLPTEAEWEYAATGGSSHRAYPWGNTAPSATTVSAYDDIQVPVGSLPANVGRYGQLDLSGSILEWVFDWYADYPSTCNDCANATSGGFRVFRTGDYTASGRSAFSPTYRYYANGFRCARSVAN